MTIEAMKQALEALEKAHPKPYNESVISHVEAITALRTAIAEAKKQEPVAWANINKHGDITHTNNKRMPWSKTPLYTTPPAAQRQWVGLTDEDFENAFQETYIMGDSDLQDFAKVIEAKLKEKNT
jgi:hypothetical protein